MFDAEKIIGEFLRELLSIAVDNNIPDDADPAWGTITLSATKMAVSCPSGSA